MTFSSLVILIVAIVFAWYVSTDALAGSTSSKKIDSYVSGGITSYSSTVLDY
jgi:hypothetical protein